VWIGAGPDCGTNAALTRSAGGIDASDAFGIAALAELGRRARFAVTNDSGPMHVLAAANVAVFGLFGPSDWRRNHALGQRANVIACVECCPEYSGLRTADCLDRLSVDMVWQRLDASALV
jgi:ADP-heptose:LPS heptosyltransferase